MNPTTMPLSALLKKSTRRALLIVSAAFVAFCFLAPAAMPSHARGELMRAIVYHDYGAPDVLRIEAIEKPVPNDDQVLVKVRAASVNPLDFHYLEGTPYIVRLNGGLFRPTIARLGVDVAGQVEAVGKNVTRFKPGDEVFGYRYGAFAEYIAAAEKSLVLKPANISFEEAAAVPIAAVTALQGLRDKGHITAGQRVLINGASGGVGTFAVQIAKNFGAEVTGVCSTRNLELVRSLGADHVIDYTSEDFTTSGQRYDLILDMVGNHALPDIRRALTPTGTLVMVGSTDVGLWLRPLTGMLNALVYSQFVSQQMVGILAELNQEDLGILRDLLQAGKLKPVIDRRYRLDEVAAAIGYVEAGHARGKVIISVEHDNQSPAPGASAASSAATGNGPALLAAALVTLFVVGPMFIAAALNRRLQRHHPGMRPYRWGYYFSIQSAIVGIVLGFMLESGLGVMVVCGGVYTVLAWLFAQRRRWAWIALTLFSFNPIVWIINGIYLWKRWAEDSAAIIGIPSRVAS